ncbi:23S rRNA (uracil(1939)-C(5))-methyltransferase RlmD [Allisonella histaminiformans]|uniref:23S rRNA (uracil(1939)-C(5))-methyltransferase RlmD n=1 Tax=Allisonella histaminiformans TaxID=209880 RepID=UPI002E76CC95|nr:23S rRNA (uracil(1939)-C(5))-methyltransferase RlmD [Allisonella histaminiformans]
MNKQGKCPVVQGQDYEVSITDLGIHGEGIGKVNGFTVFVPGALPGERAEVRIIRVKKSYATGKLVTLKEQTPHRVKPECPVYDRCGGCQISHISYEEQLAIKHHSVVSVIERIAGEDGSLVEPVIPAAHPFGYRNKMAIPAGFVKGVPSLGYYRQGTHDIVPTAFCNIQKEENNELLRFAAEFIRRHSISCYNEKTGKGSLRHVMGRVGDDGKLMVVLITATRDLPCEEAWVKEMTEALPFVVSIYHNVQDRKGNVILGKTIRKLYGSDTLKASIGALQFEVSPYSFFQVHKEQAEVLYSKALEFAQLTGKETVIDAYCGTGTISLYLAQKAKHVLGIEIVPAAIEDAKKNAVRNHVDNADFLAADAGVIMPKLYKQGTRPDVIVMDPIRAGCSEDVLKAAAGMQPERIVYVSCGPSTFARDAKILSQLGYKLKKVQPVDMFPQTTHVELVALLERK